LVLGFFSFWALRWYNIGGNEEITTGFFVGMDFFLLVRGRRKEGEGRKRGGEAGKIGLGESREKKREEGGKRGRKTGREETGESGPVREKREEGGKRGGGETGRGEAGESGPGEPREMKRGRMRRGKGFFQTRLTP
jgi:hypothetical protein